MKRTKTLTVALLSVLCAAALALSAVGLIPTKKVAAAEDKTLEYSLSCFNTAGEAKGTLNNGGTWGAVTNAGAQKSYINIIFGTDSRYITFTFNEAISAEDYVSIDFGMNFFGGSSLVNQSDKAQIYKPAVVGGVVSGTSRTNTDVEVDAGWYVDTTNGSAGEMNVAVNNVSIPTSAIKQDDGLVYGFTIRCVAEATSGAHYAIMSDLVAKAATPAEPEKEVQDAGASVIYDFDGTQAYGNYSNGAADPDRNNISMHVTADNDPNAPVFSGDGSTKMMFTGGAGVAADGWVRIEFEKKIPVADFPRMILRMCVGNWKTDQITTRIYKLSDTERTNAITKIDTVFGNACVSWAVDTASIAEDGFVSGFYLTREDVSGNKGQYFFDYVQFLIEADIPRPVVSEDVASKDVSELMPVGSDGVTFGLTSNGKQSGEEGYGAYSEKVSLKTAAADEITFNFTPTYEADCNFSVYFLLKAKSDSDFSKGGLVFWFSDSNILIGNGTKNDYAKMMKADYPEGAFASGKATKIKISAIPYYLEGVREGYYLALYINGAETPALDIYVADVDSELGEYTKIVMQDLGKDYSVKISSASATPTAAADVMKVMVATTSGKTTFDKPRAGLTLSHFAIDGETVSELKIDGDATYNAETKTLNFNSEGTVKVSFTVTNAFGTFTSNELALTYDDGVANETEEKSGCDCGSSINGIGISALVLAAGAVIIAVKRRKHD